MSEDHNCDECGKPAKQICSSCKSVFYCSRDCQKKGWKNHKSKCKPTQVQNSPVYGRHLVATRDIKAGEIILKEPPALIGPKARTVPICLGCHKLIAGTYRCSKCRYPMCAPSCEVTKYHKKECPILVKIGDKINFSKIDEPLHVYDSITPLRCILTKESEPEKWNTIINLQSHYEQIKKTEIKNLNQINVIDFIRKNLDYTEVDENTIQKVCGILTTNTFELKHNKQKVRGLFPQASMLAHSCTPNVKHCFDEDLNIILRTTRNVTKGTPLTITYSHIFWNTLTRRKGLKTTKFFDCTCKRCSDPTEFGTELSTLICTSCKGNVRCMEPLKDKSPWICDKCAKNYLRKQVLWGDEALAKEIKNMDKTTPKELEEFLKNYKEAIHEGHRFFVEAKYALCKFYGNYPGYTYSELTREQIENKVKYCKQLLKVADALDPGKSMTRGTLLFELQAAKVALAKTQVSCEEITQDKCGEILAESVTMLKEASEILKHEPEMENGGLDERLNKLSQDLEL